MGIGSKPPLAVDQVGGMGDLPPKAKPLGCTIVWPNLFVTKLIGVHQTNLPNLIATYQYFYLIC